MAHRARSRTGRSSCGLRNRTTHAWDRGGPRPGHRGCRSELHRHPLSVRGIRRPRLRLQRSRRLCLRASRYLHPAQRSRTAPCGTSCFPEGPAARRPSVLPDRLASGRSRRHLRGRRPFRPRASIGRARLLRKLEAGFLPQASGERRALPEVASADGRHWRLRRDVPLDARQM